MGASQRDGQLAPGGVRFVEPPGADDGLRRAGRREHQ